ncbi:MAG TPA: flagellar hook protein FlgE [Blastocatellia bacterium]|nr:flagellar hook protein FlgE [Blastocatellia bacterium]
MSFSFSTALSGLTAASEKISVSGNNIANANTVGFKSSSVSFADVFTNSSGIRLNGAGTALQFGKGVRLAATPTDFSQGTLDLTNTATNAAIEGNGFFVLADSLGALSYSRAGDFSLDRSGNLVNPSGHYVQGYRAVDGVIPSGASLTTLNVPIGETQPPVITSEATFRMNLNSKDPVASDFHALVNIYDSKGAAHKMDLVFTKQADGSYLMQAQVDGTAATTSVNGGAASAAPVTVTFDSNGLLTAPSSLAVIPPAAVLNGATLPSITINLRQPAPPVGSGVANITNYASPSSVASTEQDGFASGELVGLAQSPDQNGALYAVFSNGQRRLLGQMGLATFNSQASLRRLGNNMYGETIASGQPSIGVPGSGGRGTIVGASLEQSNVDIATEFTNLIVAQRGFQANSRVITTISQTLQDLLQIQ